MSAIEVLGSANMDLVVRQSRLPVPGETIFGRSFRTVPGGKGLNQAVAAARAGGDVGFLGAIGRDPFGVGLRNCLQAEGIRLDGLVEVDEPTGMAHVAVVDGGENAIVVVPGANAAITALAPADRDRIADARYLVAQFERPLDLVVEAFEFAQDRGVGTVLTPAPVAAVPAGLLEGVDILILNSHEACELTALDDDVAAAVQLSGTCEIVVLTRGSRGAVVAERGAVRLEVAARRVTAVDTTAAGDTFAGVMIAMLAEGRTLEVALELAAVAASISVTREGASISMPTMAEIRASWAGAATGTISRPFR